MKCNTSIDGECLFNNRQDVPQMRLIKASPENMKEDIEYYNKDYITPPSVEITKIQLSLIKCDGGKGKEGCPYKVWKE